MGTASPKKFIKQTNGVMAEEPALLTTAGAADADRIPALNAAGVLDVSIINGVNTSAGAGSAAKTPVLDASGRLDQSFMPTGVVPETGVVIASEALASGDFVNIWNNAGVASARKADASTAGKHAHGFVQAAVANAANATVFFEGSNTGLTGLLAGDQFLSATTPGKSSATAPTASGQVVQTLGTAFNATSLSFEPTRPIILA